MDAHLEQELDRLAEKYGLVGHQINYLKFFLNLYEVRGRDVLEVGGALPAEIVIDLLGCNSWTATESPDYNESLGVKNQQARTLPHERRGYEAMERNVEDFDDELTGCFDTVFSIACFEHIAKLPQALDRMYQLLRPDGKLFSLFAPVWSSSGGHHYMGAIPGRFDVVDRSVGAHINPFQHLLQSRHEVHADIRRRFDREYADEVVYQLFNNPHINRYYFEDYYETVTHSHFEVELLSPVFGYELDSSLQSALETRCPGYRLFNSHGLLIRLAKGST